MNIARLLYIGSKMIGFTEEQVLGMTPRKFFMLYDEHLYMSGIKKKDEASLIEMLP